jgi:hypothetical protein
MNKVLPILLILFAGYACIETEPVSPVPEITFKSLELVHIVDTSPLQNPDLKGGLLVFDFIDGDANFGIYESTSQDSTLPDSLRYNLFLKPFYKLDGVYYFIEPDTNNPPPYYSVFYNEKLDRVGQNKTVKGTITLTIYDLPFYDTIKYDFFVRDRDSNKSNVESTTDLGIN